jgi:regulator of cell morphogenesis and NO signaling
MSITINPTNTVRELVTAMPEATRVFERLGIDYCCGGSRTLTDACHAVGVPVEEVVRELEVTEQTDRAELTLIDWRQESLAALMTFIVDEHHQFTRHELERLDKLSNKVCAVHGKNHPELLELRARFSELREELTTHMLKEEQALFPWVMKMEEAVTAGQPVPPPFFRTVRNPVQMMMKEHDRAGELLRLMRAASGDYSVPADGCFSFGALYQGLQALEADLHQHIHLENNLLFPRAEKMENAAVPALRHTSAESCEHHCFSHS